MNRRLVKIAFGVLLVGGGPLQGADLGGVLVRLEGRESSATVSARVVGPFRIEITVNPGGGTGPLAIRVDLPESGPRTWPAADVEVRDDQGKALVVRRTGTEWFTLIVPVPAVATTYTVRTAAPPAATPALPSEKERWLAENALGLRLGIAQWHDGRKAALSIRFDDSHPTHLTKAIPILREYGLRGTFMVNPGGPESGGRRGSDFQSHQAEWSACARQGDQELANHTAHHRGAVGDDDMEAEIGDAAQALWKLTPGKSRLMALNLGGGTRWETSRPLRYYLDKYHLFDTSGSLGMDDVYGNRVAALRQHLEGHLKRGLWCRIHYHSIGKGLSSSEANFRAALDVVREHRSDLWIAGMADIYKYQTERNASKLKVRRSDPARLVLDLVCLTDATLFDQPLTVAVAQPQSPEADRLKVRDAQGNRIPLLATQVEGVSAMCFEAAPRTATYSIERTP